jgi:hypothetical protein
MLGILTQTCTQVHLDNIRELLKHNYPNKELSTCFRLSKLNREKYLT